MSGRYATATLTAMSTPDGGRFAPDLTAHVPIWPAAAQRGTVAHNKPAEMSRLASIRLPERAHVTGAPHANQRNQEVG